MPGSGLVEYFMFKWNLHYFSELSVHGFRTQNASFPAQYLSKLSWKPQS